MGITSLLNFESYSIWINLAVFAGAAAVVWYFGTRISFIADTLSDRTGLGKAFMGLLFLAVATSLPEIGTTTFAAIGNTPALAVNNLVGSIMLNFFVLVLADLLFVRGALTFFTPRPVLLLQGVLLVALLALVLAALSAGEFVVISNVGLSTPVLALVYIIFMYLSQRYEKSESWKASTEPSEEQASYAAPYRERAVQSQQRYQLWSTPRMIGFFAMSAGVIFIAGMLLAQVGDVLAVQTGLGTSFVGVTLLAFATSLPEMSSTFAATRIGNYSMAISNIFGSNSFMVAMLFIADVFYLQGPILSEVEEAARFSTAMGIVLSTVFLAGLIERRDRTLFRVGVDSALVGAMYFGSLGVLYVVTR